MANRRTGLCWLLACILLAVMAPRSLHADAVLRQGEAITLRIRQVLPADGLSPGERLLNSRQPIQPGDPCRNHRSSLFSSRPCRRQRDRDDAARLVWPARLRHVAAKSTCREGGRANALAALADRPGRPPPQHTGAPDLADGVVRTRRRGSGRRHRSANRSYAEKDTSRQCRRGRRLDIGSGLRQLSARP